MVTMVLLRQSVNCAIHLAAGVVFGAVSVVALERLLRRERHGIEAAVPPAAPVPPSPEAGPPPPEAGSRR